MIDKKRIIILILLVWIFGMSLLSMVMPNQTFSRMENRYLAEFPTVSLRNVLDGSFEEKFELYLNDHFALRDIFVRLSKLKSYALGIREFGDVYYAKDDTLLRRLKPNEERASANTAAIAEYAKNAEIPVDFALIPGAVAIWNEKLPDHVPNYDQEAEIQRIYDSLGSSYVNCVDMYEALVSHDTEYIYYHTDHHWTSLGAYYGYAAYIDTIGQAAASIADYKDTSLSEAFLGTLYSDAPFPWIAPDEIHAYVPDENISVTVFDGMEYQNGELYVKDNLKEKNQYTVFLGGNQPLITVQSQKTQGEKLLIVRDSYMDSMTPFLTTQFSEIHLIDPRYYKQELSSYIEEHDIDRVLICMSLSSYMESSGLLPILK